MDHVFHETEEAVFKFKGESIIFHLKDDSYSYDAEEGETILHRITSNDGDCKTIPSDNQYFEFIVLDLMDKGEGSLLCKRCEKIYSPGNLQPFSVGWGRSPFSPDITYPLFVDSGSGESRPRSTQPMNEISHRAMRLERAEHRTAAC